MNSDPHAGLREQALTSILDGPAHSSSEIRHAAASNRELPADLAALIGKVHAHAYRVTDEDVAKAQREYGDDKLFEIIVSAAVGASRQRLEAGLKALEDA